MPGLHIAFEGGEGVGKSTLARRLAEELNRSKPNTAYLIRQPGGSPRSEAIREFILQTNDLLTPEEEIILFAAQRIMLNREHVNVQLASGHLIIADRCFLSGLVYQGFARQASPIQQALLEQATEISLGGRRPELILLLDAPVEVSLPRVRRRQTDQNVYDRQAQDFHERVRAGYLIYQRRWPELIVRIDATQTPDAVYAAVLRELSQRKLTPAA